jgi:hypothetical protein
MNGEMDGYVPAWERLEMQTKISESLKGKDHLEDVGADGRKIFQ